MIRNRFKFVGTLMIALALWGLFGCAPPPPPAPAPAPVVVSTGPSYRPTTEEWVHLPARIGFEPGSSYVNPAARAMLAEAHASMAARTDIVRIRIEGHTDPRGPEANNDRLALERAQNVMDYIVGTLGMPRELFEVQGFGSTRPVTSNTTEADRAQNRRVEFTMLVRRQAAY